jgi:hypothetical protein
MPNLNPLVATTYRLSWSDGALATIKVLAEGEQASIVSIEGARARVEGVLIYKTARGITAELRLIAITQHAALRIERG